MVRAFIQARMSSERFPGKVLAPCGGRPLLDRVAAAAASVVGRERVVIATSEDATDDPLAAYVRSAGLDLYRGPLDDVFARFLGCLEAHPCDWFFRVCADSPLLPSALLERAWKSARDDLDLVTNVALRTYPRGHSVELLRAEPFASIDASGLDAREREHPTRIYYAHPERFRILNLTSDAPESARLHWAVDTLEDLCRVEAELARCGAVGGDA